LDRIIPTRDTVFTEDSISSFSNVKLPTFPDVQITLENPPPSISTSTSTPNAASTDITSTTGNIDLTTVNTRETLKTKETSQRFSSRLRQPSSILRNPNFIIGRAATATEIQRIKELTPRTYQEAITSDKASEWRKSMQEEINALNRNKTWILVPPPPNRKILGSKWVFRIKQNPDGSIEKRKSRLVAQGNKQEYLLEFKETFSPVIKMKGLRTMFAVAQIKGYEIIQLDVNSAYLYGPIDIEIYMRQPEGFKKKGPNGEILVCKLKKSLYGLKQAGRIWNHTLHKHLIQQGFRRSKIEPCLYLLNEGGDLIAVAVYVDDITCMAPPGKWKNFVTKLRSVFQTTEPKQISWILQTAVTRTHSTISLSQKRYITEMLEKFKMKDCKTAETPMEPGCLRLVTNSEPFQNVTLYKQLVGSIIYLSTVSRPDIAFAANFLSRAMDKPTKIHWATAKRVLRYLKRTMDKGLNYISKGNTQLVAYSDSDFAGDVTDRKSTTGYVMMLGNCAISWCSKKQPIITLSSTEAELVAANAAAKEIKFLRNLLKDLGLEQKEPTILYVDNRSTICIATDHVISENSKHIDVRYFWIREEIENKTLTVEHVPTDRMLADILTKPLTPIRFEKGTKIMN
jgi:hypothetical protein